MKEFTKLTEDQQTLFSKLERRISQGKSVEGILKKYKPKNQDSKNEDIKAVFTAFQEGELVKQGCVSEKYTLSALAVQECNVEALKQILNAVEKIDGLKKKILTEVQFKGFEGKGFTLLGCVESCIESDYKNPDEENAAEEIVKIINNMIQVPEEQKNQDAGPDPVISSLKSPSSLNQHKGKVLPQH